MKTLVSAIVSGSQHFCSHAETISERSLTFGSGSSALHVEMANGVDSIRQGLEQISLNVGSGDASSIRPFQQNYSHLQGGEPALANDDASWYEHHC